MATKAAKPTKIQDLFEGVKPSQVDRAAGVIRGVKVLGHVSANGREYSKGAVTQARGLYEGIRVNVNHPSKPGEARSLNDRFGRLVNVRETGDGLYADLEYLKAHPLAEMTAEAAERMPDQLGLSHNAEGRVVNRGGKKLVEEITRVRSVDLVSDPATVRGLFEAEGTMDDVAMLGEPMAEPAPGDAIKDAFKAEINKIIDGDGDLQSKKTAIADLLKTLDQTMQKLSGEKPKADKPADGGDEGDSGDTPESRKDTANPTLTQLQEQIVQLRVRDEVRDLFEAAGVKPEPLQLKAACLLPTTDERKKFVEAMKGLGGNVRTTRQPLTAAMPLTEGREPVKKPANAKEFAALVR